MLMTVWQSTVLQLKCNVSELHAERRNLLHSNCSHAAFCWISQIYFFCCEHQSKVQLLLVYFGSFHLLITRYPLFLLGLCSRLIYLLLFLLVVYTLGVRQRRRRYGRCAAGMRGPHPVDYARLRHAILGKRLREDRLQRVNPFFHTALSRSGVTFPHPANLLGVVFPVLLILSSSIQIIIKGNDVGDLLFLPPLLPQPWVWVEKYISFYKGVNKNLYIFKVYTFILQTAVMLKRLKR